MLYGVISKEEEAINNEEEKKLARRNIFKSIWTLTSQSV
jgi:hypothetical protein